MSYHLSVRSLRVARSCSVAGGLNETLQMILGGDTPAVALKNEIGLSCYSDITSSSISEKFSFLMAVDLNPLGQIFRLAKSGQHYKNIWDTYNRYGNVVTDLPYQKIEEDTYTKGQLRVSFSDDSLMRRAEMRVYNLLQESFHSCSQGILSANKSDSALVEKISLMKVSSVAGIYNAKPVVQELAKYFETFPRANVADACYELGCSQRALERLMKELGLRTGTLKRACMVAGASTEIVNSQRSFAEIARRHGFHDTAHLTRSIACAAGGMAPSVLREIVRNV